MGSGGGGNQTTVQKADPWEGQQPYLRNIFSEATKLYGLGGPGGGNFVQRGNPVTISGEGSELIPGGSSITVGDPTQLNNEIQAQGGGSGPVNTQYWPKYYPGETVARFSPEQQQALQGGREYASGPAQQYTNEALQASVQALNAPDVANNPYVQGAAKAAIDPAYQSLTRDVLPQVTSEAISAGQIGSSRQGVLEANALNDFTRNALNTTSDIYNQAYQTGVQARGQALALAPETARLGNYPNELMSEIGALRQAQDQRETNADVSRWNYQQELPYEMLRRYRGFVAGDYGGQTQTTAPMPTTNPALGTLGGAASGAAVGSQIYPGWGTAIGAVVGAGMGYFGSQ